jgi:hypothetical protein
MIDNAIQVERLIAKLQAELPLATRMTPELTATLAKQNHASSIPVSCKIISVRYTGDEGGILCQLELSPPIENAVYASITHLRFDPRQPLARDITAYQKHRVKHLRRH